ncbi:kinase-like domain-containing protein [Syncephalastrum racemosum]|uniref:Kinase-like domain-containing protein n=1 Tax=Syncephalastrum racemosum TaxID=13706 RepID=A0A1X2HUX0_SYNRA|nr:kinase-like domain-containing protein [Syncephalastrum racemosum]
MARALVFIHSQGIVHCDLSPTNILLDTMGRMVLTDFGCAHRLRKDYQTDDPEDVDEIGTRPYKAPEHLFGHRVYTSATDVWSLGAIVGELLLGRRVFRGESDLEAIGSIVRTLGPPPKQVQDRVNS